MSTRRSNRLALVAIGGFLLFLLIANVSAQQPQRPAQEPPPRERPPAAAQTAPPSPRPATPIQPFKPGEEISPGRKVSIPNDM